MRGFDGEYALPIRLLEFMHMDLPRLLSLEANNQWLMTPVERLVIVGLLERLRPKRTLELGHRFGGCTEWLCKYSGDVYSVDLDAAVIDSCKRWPNAHAVHGDTQAALKEFRDRGMRFDFVVVDADHSRTSARDDLLGAAAIGDVLVLHDSFNPECRAGYLEALNQLNVYSDLDLADGHVQSDGLWGGLGIVVTSLPRSTKTYVTPRVPNFDILARAQSVLTSRRFRLRHAVSLLRQLFRRNIAPVAPGS
jgi:hypothetical protein